MIQETFPMICSKVLSIEILIERIDAGNGLLLPHIATVDIGHDGSVLFRERIEDIRRNSMDNEVGYAICKNWEEFKAMDNIAFHPAQMIEEWMEQENISIPWIKVK